MGAREERNTERARHWQWTWNNDVMRMVDECYAEHCEVSDMLRGRTFHGREELRLIEEQIEGVDASRRMEVTKMVASGDTVALEMNALWDEGRAVVKAAVFLTFDDDGMIVSDHSYSIDPVGAGERDPRD